MMMMDQNNKPTPLKKTTSFALKKTMSMDQSYHHRDHQHQQLQKTNSVSRIVGGGRRSPVEFPTFPDVPQLGDEIFHLSHPQHPISQTRLPDLFTCAACKEYGAGDRFTCTECDFQLHDFCAMAPPALQRHPIHPLHKIVFSPKSVKGGILKSRCEICAKSTKGSVFKCTVCNFQMHPCCAMLSTEINISVHPHTLRLLPMSGQSSTSSLNGADSASGGFACGECNRRRSGRVFHCTVCDYHLHAVCAKNMVNGLQANGLKGMDKPSMLGTAAKIASKVMIEFIGGLIEGIGEGVGQVLIQTAARGRCRINRSARTA